MTASASIEATGRRLRLLRVGGALVAVIVFLALATALLAGSAAVAAARLVMAQGGGRGPGRGVEVAGLLGAEALAAALWVGWRAGRPFDDEEDAPWL